MTPVIDAHAHLADPKFLRRLDSVIADAAVHGVTAIVSNAATRRDWDALPLLGRQPGVRCAVGIHPFFRHEWTPEARDELLRLLDETPRTVAAIGEIGLDGMHEPGSMPEQRRVLAEQLEIARAKGVPVCLHLRKAWQPFFELLRELRIDALSGYCHNMTASPEIARRLLDLGLHLSFGAAVANPLCRHARQSAALVPLSRLLTETDAPDRADSPAAARIALRALAEIRGMPEETLADLVADNVRRLFP